MRERRQARLVIQNHARTRRIHPKVTIPAPEQRETRASIGMDRRWRWHKGILEPGLGLASTLHHVT